MTNTQTNKEIQSLYKDIVEEVKEKVQKLKELGLSEKEISLLLHSEQPLLQLTVSKNHRIFIGEKRTEVCTTSPCANIAGSLPSEFTRIRRGRDSAAARKDSYSPPQTNTGNNANTQSQRIPRPPKDIHLDHWH